MKNLGDIQWIFAKTADGKPIEELEKFLQNKLRNYFLNLKMLLITIIKIDFF